MMDGAAVPVRRSLAQSVERLRHSRLAMAAVALVCGLGVAASGVTLVRAADDAGIIDFFRSSALSRFVDPIRVSPRYADEPRFVYRPAAEARRRQARRLEARRVRQAEIRRAAPRRPPARRKLASELQPRPGLDERAPKQVGRGARVALAMPAGAAGRSTMCVRTCDGYLFPIGTLHSRGDLGTHQTACNAACPGTETRLYTLAPGQRLENPGNARSVLDGTVYARLKTAFLFRKTTVASCDCQKPGVIASHLPILLDPTLRRGDVVVDGKGDAQAFAGTPRPPISPRSFSDYEGSRALSRTAKAQVDKVMGTTLRRKIAAAYERSERRRLAGLRPAPDHVIEPAATRNRSIAHASALREVRPPAGSGSRVRAFTVSQGDGTLHPSGARIVTVQ